MSLATAADQVDSPASSDGDDAAGVLANSSDQWVTRCICVNNSQVEGFMIECERCQVWQHGDCVRVDKGKVPDEYFCELCRPELHDARGLWTGGIRSQPTGKVALSRSNSSKKKKTKSRKQSAQAVTPSGPAGNGAGEGSSDNAMIDVRGIPTQPDPATPGAAAQTDPIPNWTEDEQKNLSREERKIVKIMQTIQMMEDRDKKRRRSGGNSATPDHQAASVAKGQAADEQISKRRKSRPNSAVKPAVAIDIPTLTIGGYDVEQLKTSPALLRNLFPVSPMYLGAKIFLLQQVTLMENASNGIVGTPIINHQAIVRDRTPKPEPCPDDSQKVTKENRTCRSRSPPSRPGRSSSISSPFSSQPISPTSAPCPDSPVNANPSQPVAAEEPPSTSISPVEAAPTDPVLAETAQSSLDKQSTKSIASTTTARLTTIPKVAVNPVRASGSVTSFPPLPAVPKPTGTFNLVPIPPIPVSGSVTPLSSLSELMQTYMNAPPTEFSPPGHLDLSRFKANPGGLLPPPSVPLISPRWDPNTSVPQFPMPPSRYLPAMPFSRRPVPPPSTSLPLNNQQSHPS